jgi:hypothetical protein
VTTELQLVGGLGHLGLQPADHVLRLPAQELDQLVDQAVVLGLADLADARARALLDMEEQAGAAQAVMVVELVVAARADRERAQ